MELETTAFIFETGQEIGGTWNLEKKVFTDGNREYLRESVFTLLDKKDPQYKSIETLLNTWNKCSPVISLKNYLKYRDSMLNNPDYNKGIICPHCGKKRSFWPFNNIGPMMGSAGFYWICMSCREIENNCFLKA